MLPFKRADAQTQKDLIRIMKICVRAQVFFQMKKKMCERVKAKALFQSQFFLKRLANTKLGVFRMVEASVVDLVIANVIVAILFFLLFFFVGTEAHTDINFVRIINIRMQIENEKFQPKDFQFLSR